MDVRRGDRSVEGDFRPVGACKDSFKYRLVQEKGRYRFESVRSEGIKGCPAGDLADTQCEPGGWSREFSHFLWHWPRLKG